MLFIRIALVKYPIIKANTQGSSKELFIWENSSGQYGHTRFNVLSDKNGNTGAAITSTIMNTGE